MEITLQEATNTLLMIKDDSELNHFLADIMGNKYVKNMSRYRVIFAGYIHQALRDTNNKYTKLQEGEVIEVQWQDVTISFTWDMISAVNNISNDYCDIIDAKNVFKVFTRYSKGDI